MPSRVVALVVFGFTTGCYGPEWQEGVECGPRGSCPPGLMCASDNRCWPESQGTPSDGPGVDPADASQPFDAPWSIDAPWPIDARDPSVDDAATADACVSSPEICNGVDDDCDEAIDEDFPGAGEACDGPDADRCEEGTAICLSDGPAIGCSDDTGDNVERCNGADDDCDGPIDEGFPLGQSCDGTDGDLCPDDRIICNTAQTGTVCGDQGGTIQERCNGVDDDCDAAIDEGFSVGQPCDGPDGDLCTDDVLACSSAGTGSVCLDLGGTALEICNGRDDDCDGATDEDAVGCALGQRCSGGACICDRTSCDGCCSGNTCSSGNDNSFCGRGGQTCRSCGTGNCCEGICCSSNTTCCPTGDGAQCLPVCP